MSAFKIKVCSTSLCSSQLLVLKYLCWLCVRLLKGVGRPDEVIACVEAGVDLFEGFFPFQVTERGCALCFNYTITPDPETAGTSSCTGGRLSPLPSPHFQS